MTVGETRFPGLWVSLLLIALGTLAVFPNSAAAGEGAGVFREPITPIAPPNGLDPRKLALGERLFKDRRLSADDSVSCADCHNLAINGADRTRLSKGMKGRLGVIKAPTVYNSRFNFVQFWDGRARSLEEQVAGPVLNPLEMASSWPEVIGKLSRDPAYRRDFAELYQSGLTAASIQDAIASFERSLVTLDAPFDRYLRGEANALSPLQLRGYRLFKSYGCIACHQGVNVGGNMYQRMGAMGDYFGDRGNLTPADLGRYNVTGRELDRYLFKVPSLRLVVRNAPYFHDGSNPTLEGAINTMARYQLGRRLPPGDVPAIIAFLSSLLGKHPLLQP